MFFRQLDVVIRCHDAEMGIDGRVIGFHCLLEILGVGDHG